MANTINWGKIYESTAWGSGVTDNNISWGKSYADLAGGGFTGLLDDYSGAAAAYSLRQLSSTYSGDAIVVRRASDNTTQSIGFVNNELDTATLESFCSGTDGFVTTWYDQSGNGNDATQSTASAQPKIVSAGSTILENGKAAVQYDSNDDILIISNASSMQIIGDMYWAQVCNASVNTNKGLFIKRIDDNNREYEFRYSGSTQFTYLDSANRKDFSVTASTAQKLHSINRIANTSVDLTINGSAFTQQSLSGTQTTSSSNVGVGGRPDPTFNYDGKIQEIVLYATDQSSKRTGIETNINTHYSIY